MEQRVIEVQQAQSGKVVVQAFQDQDQDKDQEPAWPPGKVKGGTAEMALRGYSIAVTMIRFNHQQAAP